MNRGCLSAREGLVSVANSRLPGLPCRYDFLKNCLISGESLPRFTPREAKARAASMRVYFM